MLVALWGVASLLGVSGSAITFNTPVRVAIVAAVIGAVANALRLVAVQAGWPPLLGTVLAAVCDRRGRGLGVPADPGPADHAVPSPRC